jgi:hypothetical protein
MATVHEGCTFEEQHCVMHFSKGRGVNTKDVHEEMFPVYGGKYLLCKAVRNWVEKFSQGRSKVAHYA